MNTVLRLALTGAAVTLAVVMALAVTGLSSTVMAQTPSDDASLSALTVSPRDITGFDPGRTSYEVGVASMVTRATVSATAADAAATVSITPDDVDGVTDGHQVDLSAGRNAVTVTVTAEDGVTTMDYTVSVNRGVTALTGWKAVDDLDGLIAAGNDAPQGIWSDGTTMWVSDVGTGKLYAYRLSDGARDAAKDFDTLIAAGNENPTGLWSDGTTMWGLRCRHPASSTPTACPTRSRTPTRTSTPSPTPATGFPSASGPTARPCGWRMAAMGSSTPTGCPSRSGTPTGTSTL